MIVELGDDQVCLVHAMGQLVVSKEILQPQLPRNESHSLVVRLVEEVVVLAP